MFEAPHRPPPTIGLTPLIDVVFILLIFVVLAANFDRLRSLKVDLPEANSQNKPRQRTLVLSISAQGTFYINRQRVSPRALPSLLRKLRKKHRILLLRADGKTALQHAVRVLDIAASLKFQSVSIATQKPR